MWQKKDNNLPIIKPTVTSSGNPMRSLIVSSFSFRMTGAIFIASGWLIQNPAPPVANQNWAWWPAVCKWQTEMRHYFNLNGVLFSSKLKLILRKMGGFNLGEKFDFELTSLSLISSGEATLGLPKYHSEDESYSLRSNRSCSTFT